MKLMYTEEGVEEMLDFKNISKQFHAEAFDSENSEGMESSISLGAIKCNVKLKQYSLMKGELIYYICYMLLDTTAGRCSTASVELGQNKNHDNTLEELGVLEGEGSVSQTTSSISQSQCDFRMINDFRIHIQDQSEPHSIRYFRIVSYGLLVALLVLAAVIYFLKVRAMNTVMNAFELVLYEHSRSDELIVLAHSVRVLRDIYVGNQQKFSSVATDRTQFYFKRLNESTTETLRLHELVRSYIDSESFFQEKFESFDKSDAVKLERVDSWDGKLNVNVGEYLSCSVSSAIRLILAKVTDVLGINKALFSQKGLTESEFSSWDRQAAFVIRNIVYVLAPLMDHMSDIGIGISEERQQVDEKQYFSLVASAASAVIISLLLCEKKVVSIPTHVLNGDFSSQSNLSSLLSILNQQIQSSYPSQTNQSSYPSQSIQPSYPSQTNQSSYPSQSIQPSQTNQSSCPNQSIQPSQKSQQILSNQPNQSNEPNEPNQSNQPNYSSKPSQPILPNEP